MTCPCGCEDEFENQTKDKLCICDFTLDELIDMRQEFTKLGLKGHLYSPSIVERNGRLALNGDYCCSHHGNICGNCPQYDSPNTGG